MEEKRIEENQEEIRNCCRSLSDYHEELKKEKNLEKSQHWKRKGKNIKKTFY